jgi:hypothetical protein
MDFILGSCLVVTLLASMHFGVTRSSLGHVLNIRVIGFVWWRHPHVKLGCILARTANVRVQWSRSMFRRSWDCFKTSWGDAETLHATQWLVGTVYYQLLLINVYGVYLLNAFRLQQDYPQWLLQSAFYEKVPAGGGGSALVRCGGNVYWWVD